ncbi:MAG: dihydroorotate dehydrogenase [Chloroflexota bacterium]
MSAVDLSVRLGGLQLKNPVMVASGTFGFGREYARAYPLSELGAVVTKGLTERPQAGNATPRIAETPSGMLNSIGLQNPGIDAFLSEELPFMLGQGATVIANIAGHTPDEFGRLAARLDRSGAAAIEINISCPNVDRGGLTFGADPALAAEVTRIVRQATELPVFVKLSPNVTDIAAVATACLDAGADGLTLINTLLGMVIDTAAQRPVLARGTGGLSGPAILPVAVRSVWEVWRATGGGVPLIGCGGISDGDSAVQHLLAGATAVQVGSANFGDPRAALRVRDGIAEYMRRRGAGALSELTGRAHAATAGAHGRPQGSAGK